VKFLVFDMDGVLVQTSGCHERAFLDLWRQCGIQGPPYSAIAGQSTREVVRQYTRPLAPSPQAVEEWIAFKQMRAREYIRTEPVVFDEVLPCLNACRRTGVGMAVATGASRSTTGILLQRAGIRDFFQFVLTSEDVRNGKPDPEIYQAAVARAGAAPGETMVVEDSLSGLEAAAAASTYVACVRSGLSIRSPFFFGAYGNLVDLTRAVGIEVI
jgi:HAD superfamily hydrolase (TIGR01509 family)